MPAYCRLEYWRKMAHGQNRDLEIMILCHVKRHSGLQRTVLVGVVPGRRGSPRSAQRWIQGIEDVFSMRVYEAGGLAAN